MQISTWKKQVCWSI